MGSIWKIYKKPNEPIWVCEIPEGERYFRTRRDARIYAREYMRERKKLQEEFLKQQAKVEFWNG